MKKEMNKQPRISVPYKELTKSHKNHEHDWVKIKFNDGDDVLRRKQCRQCKAIVHPF